MIKIERKIINVRDLALNSGQIPEVPKNPRFIKNSRFQKLVKSIEDDPEFLEVRELIVFPFKATFVVLGGNMRLRACMELGISEIPCKVLPKDLPKKKLRAFAIKDNEGFGENDWEILANEWDQEELEDWGMELPANFGVSEEEELPEEKTYIPTFKFEVICKTEAEKNKLMAELMGRGITCTDDY